MKTKWMIPLLALALVWSCTDTETVSRPGLPWDGGTTPSPVAEIPPEAPPGGGVIPPPPGEAPPDTVIPFADLRLQAKVNAALAEALDTPRATDAPVTVGECAGLTSLNASLVSGEEVAEKIADLSGIEYCTSLTFLSVRDSNIDNITPLAELTNLSELGLSGNFITDITPPGRIDES